MYTKCVELQLHKPVCLHVALRDSQFYNFSCAP